MKGTNTDKKHDRRNRPHDGSLGDLLDRCGHHFAHRVGGSKRGRGNVMEQIDKNPGITQKELAELLEIQPASLSEVLIKLERKGFVEREKDAEDRRVIRVSLTDIGQAEIHKAEELSTDPFQTLTKNEQALLKELLNKLLTDWEVRYPMERHRRDHDHNEPHHHQKHDEHEHPHGRKHHEDDTEEAE